jgi:hypothetical protein
MLKHVLLGNKRIAPPVTDTQLLALQATAVAAVKNPGEQ